MCVFLNFLFKKRFRFDHVHVPRYSIEHSLYERIKELLYSCVLGCALQIIMKTEFNKI